MTAAELRAARKRLGLTQAQLAALLDIPQPTIARWERGTIAIRHGTLLRLALERLAGFRSS
jgi:transcriptional regulator with XRE-family HTH domain